MSWTPPATQVTGYKVTATDWDNVENNLAYLYGDTAWTNLSTFTNGWSAVTANQPRFSRTGNLVTMQGQITGGTINTTAFTLPAGYRPSSAPVVLSTAANFLFGQFNVASNGTVMPIAGSTTNFSIACVFSVL